MAVKYKEVKDKLEKTPLTPSELKEIDIVEQHIDSEIHKQYKGGDVSIDLTVANFDYFLGRTQQTNHPFARKKLMRKELDKRYKEAGWKIREHIDDGLEGNLSGSDYWILSGY